MKIMPSHKELWAISFLKMAIRMVGMPVMWIRQNSRFWNVRITESGITRITEDGNIRITQNG